VKLQFMFGEVIAIIFYYESMFVQKVL